MARDMRVVILGDEKDLLRSLRNSTRATQKFSLSMGQIVKGAVGFLAVQRAASLAGDQIRESIVAASDLNEQQSKANVVFGRSAAQIQRWAETTSRSFGVSQRAALAAAGGFGQILETSGFTEGQAAQLSRSLVELGADMASFNNITVDEALLKLRSGLAGEAEPLRTMGVLLSEARVKEEAYASGIAKRGAVLTEAQKVQARYNLILRDTGTAQGDFARTSGGLANQQRILTAQIDNLQAKIGTALLPVIKEIVSGINEWLADSRNQEKVQRTVTNTIAQAISIGKAFVGVMRDVRAILVPVIDNLGGLQVVLRSIIALAIVSKVSQFAQAFGLMGRQAAVATTQAKGLQSSLLAMSRLGPIAIAITLVIVNRNEITDFFNDLTNKLPKGAQGGDFVIGPQTSLEELQEIRKALQGTGGDSKEAIAIVDKFIKKLLEVQPAGLKAASGLEKFRIALPSAGGADNAAAITSSLDKIMATFRAAVTSALKRAKTKQQATISAFPDLLEALNLKLDEATAKKGFADDLKVLDTIEAAVRREIQVEGRTTALARELLEVRQKRAAIMEQIAQASSDAADAAVDAAVRRKQEAAAALQARQFRALGLTAMGEERTPTISNLRKQLKALTERLATSGTTVSSKLRGQLAGIRKVLSGEFGKATEETRAKIKELFDTIRGSFKDESAKGPLTKTSALNASKIVEGLGLGRDLEKELRARLSRFNSAGLATGARSGQTAFAGGAGTPIVINTTVELDRQAVGQSTKRFLLNDRRHNPPQKRGPNAG